MFKKPNQHYPNSTPPQNPTIDDLVEIETCFNPKMDRYSNFEEWLSDPTGMVELKEKNT